MVQQRHHTVDWCYSLLRNRKTLRTLESGHFNLRPVNTNGGFTEGGCEHDIKTRPFCVVIVYENIVAKTYSWMQNDNSFLYKSQSSLKYL